MKDEETTNSETKKKESESANEKYFRIVHTKQSHPDKKECNVQ